MLQGATSLTRARCGGLPCFSVAARSGVWLDMRCPRVLASASESHVKATAPALEHETGWNGAGTRMPCQSTRLGTWGARRHVGWACGLWARRWVVLMGRVRRVAARQ